MGQQGLLPQGAHTDRRVLALGDRDRVAANIQAFKERVVEDISRCAVAKR